MRCLQLTVLITSSLVCTVQSSCSRENGDKDDSILIGAIYPFTGNAARYGEDSRAAAEMAMEEIRADGPIAGRELKILFRDSRASADRAREIAREFVLRDNVDFLLGVVSSSAALAVSDIARDAKRIFVGTDHGTSRLTYQAFHKYYFRVSNNTDQATTAGAFYAADENWARYFVIGPDYEYGHMLWSEFCSHMERLDKSINVVGEAWPRLFEPDYTSFIAAIRSARPDVVFCSLWGGDLVTFIRQASAVGLFENTVLFSPDTGGNYEVFAALGDAVPLGLILGCKHHNNWPQTAANRRFVEAFRERTGRYPTYAAHGAYVGVRFIAEALRRHGNLNDIDGLIAVMEGLVMPMPEDPPGFVARMDPLTHQMVQSHAIGVTEPNKRFLPATRMLGKWKVFNGNRLMPSPERVAKLRGPGD